MNGSKLVLVVCLLSLILSVAGCGGGGDGSNVSAVAVVTTAGAKKTVTMTDLGTLGGFGSSYAYGINDKGQIVGESTTSSGASHAFIWQDGVMTDLGTLGKFPGYDVSRAYGINKSGQVVGESITSSGELHAFMWHDGTMTDLGTLGGNFSHAYAINDKGQVVGQTITSVGAWRAFIWQDGVMTDLGTLGGDSIAFGINNQGQVVGLSVPSSQTRYAFIWQNGVMTPLLSLVPAEDFGGADAINDKGEVVGWSSYAFDPVAWQSGAITAIGTLGSGEARGVNNNGLVAGYYSPAKYEGNYTCGFIWRNGVVIDLPSLGGFRSAAYAINDKGEVAGYSATSSGDDHAVLWSGY